MKQEQEASQIMPRRTLLLMINHCRRVVLALSYSIESVFGKAPKLLRVSTWEFSTALLEEMHTMRTRTPRDLMYVPIDR